MQTIRMFNDENNLKVIPTHTAGGGYMVGAEAAKRDGVSINIGPRVVDMGWGAEHDNRFHGMGAEYFKAGVRNLSINTDAVGLGAQEGLALQASMSARLGLDDEIALRAITINSARALDIDDRVGSLEVGKDANLLILSGDPLDVGTQIYQVMLEGKIVYHSP